MSIGARAVGLIACKSGSRKVAVFQQAPGACLYYGALEKRKYSGDSTALARESAAALSGDSKNPNYVKRNVRDIVKLADPHDHVQIQVTNDVNE